MNKKRIFGIVLFIIIGLFTFTFANPNEKVEENGNNNQPQEEVKKPVVDESKVENDNTEVNEPTVVITPVINQNNQSDLPQEDNTLEKFKNAKIEEIKKYQEDKNLNENEKANKVIEDSTNKINSSTTKEEIEKIVEEAKKELDKIKEELDLEQEKENAIKEIKKYQEDKNLNENEKANKVIEDSTNKINNAKTKEEIEKIVEETKKELDKIKEELDLEQEKENAIKEIKKYQEDKNLNENEKANKVIEDSTNKINNAKTKEEIEKIVEETKKELDKIKEELDLENIKNKAIEEVKNYKKEELYSEENNSKVKDLKEEAINKINNAKTKEEVEKIVEEVKKEIDSILTLKETSYNVKFIDLKGEIVKEEQVLYGKSAIAPDMNNIEINGITYSFTAWNKEYTNITSNLEVNANYEITQVIANVYESKLIGTVKLNITDKIKEVISNNTNTIITTNESDIVNLSIDTLPVLNKLNYRYNYYELSYTLSEGFIIKAQEIIDEKSLEKNTVTITYNINSDIATFLDGTKQFKSTTYTGTNTVELPKVYIDGKEVAVNWNDENGNIISKISENEVSLIDELQYNKSTTLTATLDNTAPVITLKGDTVKNIDLTFEEDYIEEGYTAIDNFNGDITSLVTTSITLNNISTNQVNYGVEGTYVITYSVSDTEGNVAIATRTIIVTDKIKEVKATVYALNDGVTRPSEKTRLKASDYHKIGEVNLVVNKVRSYLTKGSVVISTSNISSYVIGGESALPKLNEKYYSYECYVLKHEKDGFHIDCEKVFDSESYKNDKLKELNELLNRDYTIYENTKTNDTYQNLINTVSEIKNNMPTTIEDIEESITKIKNAISSLVDVVLVDIKLSSNNDTYTLNSNMKTLTVTAVYNDTTKNRVLTKNDYTVNKNFDSKTIGNKSITYSYQNKQVVYNYVVEYSNAQLQAKVNSIEASLKEKISLKKTEYKIIFSNLQNDVSIKSINVTKNNKVLSTIKLTKVSHDTYSMNRDDYFTLVNNNTTIGNKKINITYKVGNQEITVSYYEAFNKLHKCK